MTSFKRIILISVSLLAIIAIYGLISYNTNSNNVVCHPTIQRRVLEIVHPYIYGLTCALDDHIPEEQDIASWVGQIIIKLWQQLVTSQDDIYFCKLDWSFVIIKFSAKAQWCTEIQFLRQSYYWLIIACLHIILGSILLGVYLFCCSKKDIEEIEFETPYETPRGDEDNDKPTGPKVKDANLITKVPKKISYSQIKQVYGHKPASKGIADALSEIQKLVCHRPMEIKDVAQPAGLVGVLSSISMEESPLKRDSVAVKGKVLPKRKKRKQVLNWVLSNNIEHVTQLADYTMLRILGYGSFAKTYLAKVTDQFCLSKNTQAETRKEDYVAMKIVDKEFLNNHRVTQNWKQTAVNELKIMEISMFCPFLMYINMAFQTPDYLVYVMPLMCGSLLDYNIPFSPRRLVLLAAEIVNGLTHLHSLGFIHRDLKADNVLIDENGHVKVSDFGCSRGNVNGKKKCYGIVGNRLFQAPEMLQGRPYNESVDFWSFGVLMYFLIEDTYPFKETKSKTRSYAMFVKYLLFQRALKEEMDFIRGLLHHDADQRLGSPSSQFGDIQTHDYFLGIDYNKLWAREYEAPCPGMVHPVDSFYRRHGSQFKGIPVRKDVDIPSEDLLVYEDFPIVNT